MVSKGWIQKLAEETASWVKQGVIDEPQRERINSYYAGRSNYSRLLNTITSLGSILVGLGIILFIASNWQKLGKPAKISIVLSFLTLFNFLGYYFRYIRKSFLGIAQGFTIISAFSFGAGIWLIAQTYQIHYNFSAGMLFWILGILPLAMLYRSWPILALSSILSLIWLFSYQAYYPQREAFGFIILLAVLVYSSYYQKQRFPLFMMIVSLCAWIAHYWVLKYLAQDGSFAKGNVFAAQLSLVTIYIFLGFLLYGVGLMHSRGSKFTSFAFFYKVSGLLLITISCYSFTFVHHYYSKTSATIIYPWQVVLLMLALIVASLAIFLRLYKSLKGEAQAREMKTLTFFIIINLIAFQISLLLPAAASLLFNIILLVEAIGFMYLAFLMHSEGLFRLSIAVFFLHILSRYFDIFWNMMPRSLLFIFGGILLIAGAVFAEHKRKEIELSAHKEAQR